MAEGSPASEMQSLDAEVINVDSSDTSAGFPVLDLTDTPPPLQAGTGTGTLVASRILSRPIRNNTDSSDVSIIGHVEPSAKDGEADVLLTRYNSPNAVAGPSRIPEGELPPTPQAPPLPPEISQSDPIAEYICPICFSSPTNACLTLCGHLMCGSCLFTAVKANQRRTFGPFGPPDQQQGAKCPVCRAELKDWDGRGGGIIPLRTKMVMTV